MEVVPEDSLPEVPKEEVPGGEDSLPPLEEVMTLPPSEDSLVTSEELGRFDNILDDFLQEGEAQFAKPSGALQFSWKSEAEKSQEDKPPVREEAEFPVEEGGGEEAGSGGAGKYIFAALFLLALAVALFQVVVPLVGAGKGWADWMRAAAPAALMQFLLTGFAFAALVVDRARRKS